MATRVRTGGARRRPRRSRRRAAPSFRAPLLAGLGVAALFGLAEWLGPEGLKGLWESPPEPEPRHALSRDEARTINAGIPFSGDRPVAARPFVFHGTPAAREQAIQCLATAALYEAGSDPKGQKAVMQVILNRVRLPGFPKTVCGVVYQGSSLKTGCQFSFTCDGSVLRRPEHDGWAAARTAARRALNGVVYTPVGIATHYHANWLVPYWIPSLDKIAMVGTHIFYRPHHVPAP